MRWLPWLAVGFLGVSPVTAQAPLGAASPSPARSRASDAEPAPSRATRSWLVRLPALHARQDLESRDRAVRLAAARRLARSGARGPAVAALLTAIAEENNREVRTALLSALIRRSEASDVPALAQLAEGLTATERAMISRALGAFGGDPAIRVLVEWLSEASARGAAARALADVGAAAVPHLLRSCGDTAVGVHAIAVLAEIGDTRSVRPLIEMLDRHTGATQVAILAALGRIGDERAARAIAESLDDPSPAVVAAAIEALGVTGGSEHAGPIAALADRGATEQRALALVALARLAPELAVPRITALFEQAPASAVLRDAAVEALSAYPTSAMCEPLRRLAASERDRPQAVDALARIPDGGGVSALLSLVAEIRGDFAGGRLALAVALRQHRNLPAELRGRAEEVLRTTERPALALVLRGLARDATVIDEAVRGLASVDPEMRIAASHALLATAPRDVDVVARALTTALRDERDPRAFRVLSATALMWDVPVAPDLLALRWWNPDTLPETLLLVGANLSLGSATGRPRYERLLRHALRSSQARTRASAALGLALGGAHGSWRALVEVLSDPHEQVRIAAARAVGSFSLAEPGAVLRAALRSEPDPRVRDLISRAVHGGGPSPVLARGRTALRARVDAASGVVVPARGVEVELMLADGRWLRWPTLEHGLLIVPDLPAGEVEARVILGDE